MSYIGIRSGIALRALARARLIPPSKGANRVYDYELKTRTASWRQLQWRRGLVLRHPASSLHRTITPLSQDVTPYRRRGKPSTTVRQFGRRRYQMRHANGRQGIGQGGVSSRVYCFRRRWLRRWSLARACATEPDN